MTLRTLPNTAALISNFLRDQPEVSALVGTRVYTVLPRSKTFPLVRVSRIGGTAENAAYWLDHPLFQIDAWADRAADAFDVAETCRAVLAQRFTGTHSYPGVSGVVTGVNLGGVIEGFDPDDPTRARTRFDAVVHVHPTSPATSS